MKNKIQIKFGLVFLILGSLACGCHEYDMVKYTEKPMINFATYDNEAEVIYDGPDDVSLTLRYTLERGYQDTLYNIIAILQGKLNDSPLNIKVKAVPVEDKASVDLEILGESNIPAGGYMVPVVVTVKCPELLDSLCAIDLVFDYEKSGILPGVGERQVYRIWTVNNIWSGMGITPDDWKVSIEPYIGGFSRMKARLVKGWTGMTFPEIAEEMNDDLANGLRFYLDYYNSQRPEGPYLDEYGHPVSFQP